MNFFSHKRPPSGIYTVLSYCIYFIAYILCIYLPIPATYIGRVFLNSFVYWHVDIVDIPITPCLTGNELYYICADISAHHIYNIYVYVGALSCAYSIKLAFEQASPLVRPSHYPRRRFSSIMQCIVLWWKYISGSNIYITRPNVANKTVRFIFIIIIIILFLFFFVNFFPLKSSSQCKR